MAIKQTLINLVPTHLELPLRYTYNRILGRLEREMDILERIVSQRRRCIDIGANVGLYTYRFSQLFDQVESFEPNPYCARKVTAAQLPNVTVHAIALSNKSGSANLSMPDTGSPEDTALASLSNQFKDSKSVPVTLRTLDDFGFIDVDLIKIDVEGHELELLEGARQTILRNSPTLLIEIEQRHHATKDIRDIFHYIEALGLAGSFYFQKHMVPIKDFSVERHQHGLDPLDRQNYVNNFIFRSTSNDKNQVV
jgi:FkbM family methyltransferase